MHRAQCYSDMKNYEAAIKDLDAALGECKGTDP